MKLKGIPALLLMFSLILPRAGEAKGVLTYQHYGRLNKPNYKEASDNWLEAGLDGRSQKRKKRYAYEMNIRVTPNDQGAIYSVPEAYTGKINGDTTYITGRKILSWSPNEKFWGLGDLDGVRSFNLLEQNQEGIMGLHFQRQSSTWDIAAFGSFLHVPQINPTFSDKDGNITAKNEWGNPPPEYVRFRGTDVPVHYDIQYPGMDEIVLQESFGAHLKYKWRGGEVAAYTAWKPENQIRINATGYYEQGQVERAVVKAKPFVNHHLIMGTHIAQQVGELTTTVALDFIRPEKGKDESFQFEALKIEPTYVDETHLSTSAVIHKDLYRIGFHYFNLLQGDVKNTNAFAKKPRWRHAIGMDFTWDLTGKLSWFADLKRDVQMQDVTIKSEARYRLARHMGLGLGIELIESPEEESFWSAYRANDTIYSNLSYLF